MPTLNGSAFLRWSTYRTQTRYLPARGTTKLRWHSAFVSAGETPIEFHSLSPPWVHSAEMPGPATPQCPLGLAGLVVSGQ